MGDSLEQAKNRAARAIAEPDWEAALASTIEQRDQAEHQAATAEAALADAEKERDEANKRADQSQEDMRRWMVEVQDTDEDYRDGVLALQYRATAAEAALAESRGRNDEMQNAYSEYVAFLEDEIGGYSGYLSAHGWHTEAEKVERGKWMRRRIAEVTGIPGHDVAEAPHEST